MKRTDFNKALIHLETAKGYIDQNRDQEFQAMHDAIDHMGDVLKRERAEDYPEYQEGQTNDE